ncbi:MAG: hypothetical protein J0M08_12120 [Bacteroidetes bacterium]|nr:hypothetical protein [Bacteroidota bacterium]
MKVGLYEFNKLTKNERADLLWQHGEFVGSVKLRGLSFSLYTLSDFYVEVLVQEDEIYHIKSFKKGYMLDKYLDRIQIDTF